MLPVLPLLAVLSVLALPVTTIAAVATSATAAPAPAAAPGRFATSFETTDPVAQSSVVERRAGRPVQSGVIGVGAHLPGSVIDSTTPITASAENSPAEVATNLADGDPATKWLAFASSAILTYHLSSAAAVSTYALTSAGDAPERDPAAWTLAGSADGTTWTSLDTRSGQTWSGRGRRNSYSIADPQAFTYYRLSIGAPQSGDLLQLADWDLAAATSGGDDEPMVTATGDGPTRGYNLKERAGFTGMHAYRYAGEQTVDGRAYETNVVQRGLHVRVGAHTRLSYTIMPEFTGDDATYPSTFAAIDVHFTDGTYLSQLRPIDQHGVALTASGQGLGKILYADQWNYESTDLGAVARGRTIDRVLLSYDDPHAAKGTDFAGWIDDVTVNPSPARVDARTLTNVVDTRRGTNASGSFSRGNNLPISARPNGFTFLTPVTDATSNSWEYYYAQANDDQNHPMLQGFSVSHEPSPWMGDRNQLSVMPSVSATPTGSPTGRALPFTHDAETARPDYYSVRFLDGLRTEMAPSDHGVVMRFTFPANDAHVGSLVFDTVDNNGSFVIDTASGTVSGWVDNGSGLSVGRSRMFFAGTFSAAPTATGTAADGHPETRYATFDTSTSRTVELRLATSFIGLTQAKHNAALELTGRSFAAVHRAASSAWQRRLSVVTVRGDTESQRETLYSNLYRLNLYPNSQFENAGTAAAPRYRYASPTAQQPAAATDTTTGARVKAGKVYVNNGFWDTYRTVWPAYSLLYPQVAADLVDGFVQQYRDGGWVARWSSPGYADLMTGTSSDVAFAGAYLRGVRLKDPLATYDAALKNATVLPASSGVGRKGLATSIFQKYTDVGTAESVSWALEGDINDAGLSQMAAQLAKDPRTPATRRAELRDEAKYFGDRAEQFVNLFDKNIGFFQGRNADGSFQQSKADYDPESWGGVYTETDGWNFAFHAPQDGQGLADLYGGRAALKRKLDRFFSTPENADKPGGYGGVIHEMLEARAVRMGQYGMSNQVSHHIPYMYDYVGAPSRTQSLVREVLRRLYVGSEIGQGYPGDEDNGEMSAWYVLSALGIYPLQSGSPNWVIGSPLFRQAVVHRSGGDLTITARNNSTRNVYVQSLRLDGRNHPSTSVTTRDLAGAARLSFTMGARPSAWGTAAKDAPPSPTKGSTAPRPDQDATSAGVGTLAAANGQDVSALTDDDSTTQTTFRSGVPVLTWHTNGAAQRVSMYTLTSGSAKGDPTGWTLEGSRNGSTWRTLDSRSDQTFRWRTQTRPFAVARPGHYSQYRLVFTGADRRTSLAEVELLVRPGTSGDAKLNVTATSAALSGRTGSDLTPKLATFIGGTGSGAADYTASIAWGDGSTSAGTITAGQLRSYAVTGKHTYAKPGYYRVAVTVSDGTSSQTAYVGITVSVAATGGIVAGFDGTCISDDGVAADCDGGGYSYSRQALADAGAVQGARVTVPGTAADGRPLTFVLPAVAAGTPDNAKGDGQQVPVSLPKDATRIAFVGAGTEGDQTANATLVYADGTTQTVAMNFPDWTLGGGGSPVPQGFTAVAATQYRLDNGGKDGAKPYLFAAPAITVAAGKTLDHITMPKQPGTEKDNGRVHLFAVADDGTPPAALAATAGKDAAATTGRSTTLTLATVTGGDASTRTARVQWGDGSSTQDATVTTANGATSVTGTHTWTAPGDYTVHVTASDGSTSDTVTLLVTVADPAAQAITATSATDSATVSGRGFRPGERVDVELASPSVDRALATRTVRADSAGRIATRLAVPSGVPAGRYAITATGTRSVTPATATIAVPDRSVLPSQVKPTLVLSSESATAGEVVTAHGTGYRPNRLSSIVLTTPSGRRTLATVRANGDGVITARLVVPAGGLGSVTATGARLASAPATTPLRRTAVPHGTRR